VKVLLVDDEPLARQRLRSLVEEIDAGFEVIAEAGDGESALAEIAATKPDIVLLDIHMPGMNGIEVAQQLAGNDTAPAVIFATAYDSYALDAFDAHAIAYLLKPVRKEKLLGALEKASRLRDGQLAALDALQGEQARSYLTIRSRGNLGRLPVSEVFYFRAEQKYVVARHAGGEALLDESLKSLEDEFSHCFVRIHRNAIVAQEAIMALEKDSLGRSRLRLKDCDELLEVSRRHVAEIRKILLV
jgi:two-component system response regulator AlgR